MKNILKIGLIGLITSGFLMTNVYADPVKGQKIFIKKFKKDCGFSGDKFASKHSQDEWESIKEDGKFKEEMIKICPNISEDKIKDKWIEHIYDFSYEYANDSGNVPSC